jgi:excisionase family DNA binding protein
MESEVLTTNEAARVLCMHPKTLLRQARQGIVPAARVGGRWKFSRRQLLAWVEEGGSRYEKLVDRSLAEEAERRMADPNRRTVPLAEVKKRLGL